MTDHEVSRQELAERLSEVSWIEGRFQLRSGREATIYFDKYRFESEPRLLSMVVDHLADCMPGKFDVMAGVELGGIPLATALSLRMGAPACFVRKQVKAYGTGQFVEGMDIGGKKLVLVEDVITTGGQVIKSANMLREAGAIVEHAVCVFLRADEVPPLFEGAGLILTPLFTSKDIPPPTSEV